MDGRRHAAFVGLGSWWHRAGVAVVATAMLGVAAPVAANAAGGPAATCTRNWAVAVSGNWADASKWSPVGVPKTTDDVCITHPGSYVVTLRKDASVRGLTLGAGSGSQTLKLSPPCGESIALKFTRTTATIAAGGTLQLIPAMSACGANYLVQVGAGGTIVNNGRIDVYANTDSNANLQNNGLFAIHRSAIWADVADHTLRQGTTGVLQFDFGDEGTLFMGKSFLGGTLKMVFVDEPQHEEFPLIADSELTGRFAHYVGLALDGNGEYFREECACDGSEGDYDLVGTRANVTAAPASGPRSTNVQLHGIDWPERGSLAVSFKDSAGAVTALGSLTAPPTGVFTTARKVPATAAKGSGRFIVRSTLFGTVDTVAFHVN